MRLLLLLLAAIASLSCFAEEQAWPFDQSPNVAAITQRQVLYEKAAILLVSHDAEDHGWQFLTGSIPPSSGNAAVAGMEQLVRIDPSLKEIADLPVGWRAHRERVGAKWVREKKSK
ncbi:MULTISPECIES: hypothetical protein [unclassified Pseudomonas]|uniref:hypothetical protein n=1 Tax=unclassified Pseudomonas TaxID=196821 RepID=UPI000CD0895F|nr:MULTISPECIES: hypothetical protein [unclassified Pseudomonas]POA31875.1 hypothetical protein C1887_12055 [Pseudomonas sp. GW456-R21]POA68606.1 hypothetical protein C1884_09700 [Pseudomonas sp. GW460-R15]TVT80113.1 hypothetical protein FPT12_23655 [Pseudomonas sp. H3(2019)]